jgi:hypothetical protein
VERVASAVNLGARFNPELNMTQKTREATREYSASVTQVMMAEGPCLFSTPATEDGLHLLFDQPDLRITITTYG